LIVLGRLVGEAMMRSAVGGEGFAHARGKNGYGAAQRAFRDDMRRGGIVFNILYSF
jgi:hypothetical protein